MRSEQLNSLYEDPLTSPCLRTCCLNDKDICLGCFRSLPEILSWSKADAATRQQILLSAEQRKQQHQQSQ